MAIKAVGYIARPRMDSNGDIRMELQISDQTGLVVNGFEFATAPSTALSLVTADLKQFVRDQATAVLGVTFNVGDDVKVYGGSELV